MATNHNSLVELLATIEGKSRDEAFQAAKAEYAIADSELEAIRRLHKTKASRVNPQLVEYFANLKMLLSALDHQTQAEFFQSPDGYVKQQIKLALLKLDQP